MLWAYKKRQMLHERDEILTELPQEVLEMTHLHNSLYKPNYKLAPASLAPEHQSPPRGPQHTLCPKHPGFTYYEMGLLARGVL